jgi:aryl-alcohol dehydrogenase-like predicted oxidoreductase
LIVVVVVATKVYFASPNGGGLSRPAIMTCIERSLKRLQTDHIDLYQIHSWDAQTSVESWLGTMKDLVACGKIRAVGVSNVTGWQMQKIVMTAASMGVPLASLQTQYSLLCREPEFELLDCAAFNKLSTLCWSPLKGGWLTGKFKRDVR